MKQHLKNITLATYVFVICFGKSILASTSLRCEDFILNSLGTFSGFYTDDLCPDNIYYLVKNLWPTLSSKQQEQARVLYIYSKWTGRNLYSWKSTAFAPLRTRNGKSKHWKFHVVLLSGGYIYDFEHNSENYPVPVRGYFRDMFGLESASESTKKGYSEKITQYFFEEDDDPPPDVGERQLMHVRSIPAVDYKNQYSVERGKNIGSDVKNYIYWLTSEHIYPDQTMESFLTELDQSHP